MRKRALSKLCKEVGGHKDNLKFLLKPVLKMLSEPVENCRAVSIELFMEYVTVYICVVVCMYVFNVACCCCGLHTEMF